MAVGYQAGHIVGGCGVGGVGVRRCRLRTEEGWEGEEVAGAGGAVGDELEDLRDEALLDACILENFQVSNVRSENWKGLRTSWV